MKKIASASGTQQATSGRGGPTTSTQLKRCTARAVFVKRHAEELRLETQLRREAAGDPATMNGAHWQAVTKERWEAADVDELASCQAEAAEVNARNDEEPDEAEIFRYVGTRPAGVLY